MIKSIAILNLSREEYVFLAKVAEQTQRYEQMIQNMKNVIILNANLNLDERKLLSVAYSRMIGERKVSWSGVSSFLKKQKAKGSTKLHIIEDSKTKIFKELDNYCQQIISLIDNYLLKTNPTIEFEIFYKKMKGDYYMHIAQCASGQKRKHASLGCKQAYQEAAKMAMEQLSVINATRLSLFLNYSTYLYGILNERVLACKLIKRAFDDSLADIQLIAQDDYREVTNIMQSLRDYYVLWTSEEQ